MSSVKSLGFSTSTFKKFPELIPLCVFIGTACVGCVAFMGYSLATKPDVRLIRSRGPAHEDVKPTESRKLIDLDKDKYQLIPQLEQLKKEIGSYKS